MFHEGTLGGACGTFNDGAPSHTRNFDETKSSFKEHFDPVRCIVRRPLATVPQIAEHYGVPVQTVRRWHHTQTFAGPLMFRVGKYLRARWDDIDAYDAEQAARRRAA
ncbi:helix-turn-helix domain-containing protein [Streptomyces virginiae]